MLCWLQRCQNKPAVTKTSRAEHRPVIGAADSRRVATPIPEEAMTQMPRRRLSRRRMLHLSAAGAAALALPAPFILRNRAALAATSDTALPGLPYGIASGDIGIDSAVIWSRSDRPARMIVEYATTEGFKDAKRIVGPAAMEDTDFTARLNLTELPADQEIFYRVSFEDLADLKTINGPLAGRFRTAPAERRNVNIVWSGDTVGQGWGINLDWGGMKLYEAMRQVQPDLFIHSGDNIYADGPLTAEVKLPDGSLWKNVTIEEKSKVAETLAEYRGNYKYNLMDENIRRFYAEVPGIFQWDDHETLNNWYPTEVLGEAEKKKGYTVMSVPLLAARAKRAFLEYTPVALNATDGERIYRTIHYGPLLDIFVLDMRSYRGPNSPNRQGFASEATDFLGRPQVAWLKQALLRSRATWKIIAADMPIGLQVPDGDTDFEAIANGDGPALGREIETAGLLRFIKMNDIRNTVWLTADVHYCAAHHYDPNRAQFQDFLPFWEFVAGPANAGTFGPSKLDNTFGPQVMFQKAPPEGQENLPPSAGYQFFGQVGIEGATAVMTVRLRDVTGQELYKVDLEPEQGV
jgi:alkaline phosphatase D